MIYILVPSCIAGRMWSRLCSKGQWNYCLPDAESEGSTSQISKLCHCSQPSARSFCFIKHVINCVGFEVLTAVVMKTHLLGYNAVWSILKVNRRFGETSNLHLQDRRINCARNYHEASSKQRNPFAENTRIPSRLHGVISRKIEVNCWVQDVSVVWVVLLLRIRKRIGRCLSWLMFSWFFSVPP
jgi:hypothetical protein